MRHRQGKITGGNNWRNCMQEKMSEPLMVMMKLITLIKILSLDAGCKSSKNY